MAIEYNATKRAYDTAATSAESGFASLNHEVRSMRSDVNNTEADCFRMEAETRIAAAQLERAQTGNFKQRLEVCECTSL